MIATAAVVAAGTVGGVYAAFSMMVIPALTRRDDQDATAAMIAINRSAERGTFVVVFAAAAIAAGGLAVQAWTRGSAAQLVAAGTSLASTAVTLATNVPLNRRLDQEGATFWPAYRRRWTTWNTLRAVLALTTVAVATAHRFPEG